MTVRPRAYGWAENLAASSPSAHSSRLRRTTLDSLAEGVYLVDLDRSVQYWNRAAERISGYDASEVVGRRCSDGILKHCDGAGRILCAVACPLKATMSDGKERDVDVFLHHKCGHRVPVNVRSAALRDRSGRIVGSVEVFSDSSSKLVAVEEAKALNRLAFIDSLTQVGNRRFVQTRLTEMLSRTSATPAGVLFLDVDHFKVFNDTHGHAVGDRVLREVAATLSGNLRSDDFVGRWGGEEFIVVTPRATLHDLQQLSDRLRELVAQTDVEVRGDTLRVHVSIGGTLAIPGDGIDSVVARADALLYESKQNGRNRATVR